MAELKLFRGEYYLWHYVPSKIAAIIFIVIFVFLTLGLLWMMIKSRTWFFSAFVIGGLFEVIGFAARASAHDKTDKLMPFVIQNTFILLAPVLFAATIYMSLARIIRLCDAESYSLIPIQWLTKTFVIGDILSFAVQGGAAGLMVIENFAHVGNNVVIGGLFIQIAVFGFFIITTVVFHLRLRKAPTTASHDPTTLWKQHVLTLYATSVMIMIRSIFRVVEFIQGYEGYLLQNEWPLYVFDAVLMVFVMVIFLPRYPSNLLVRDTKEGLLPLRSLP